MPNRFSIAPTPAANMMKCGAVTARYPLLSPVAGRVAPASQFFYLAHRKCHDWWFLYASIKRRHRSVPGELPGYLHLSSRAVLKSVSKYIITKDIFHDGSQVTSTQIMIYTTTARGNIAQKKEERQHTESGLSTGLTRAPSKRKRTVFMSLP